MNQIEEKTIIAQVRLNLLFLGAFIKAVKSNPNQKIEDFFNEWHKKIKWDRKNERYSLINQGVILTSLYGLIVYPKEIFFNNIPKISIESLNKDEWGNISIEMCPDCDKNLQGVVKHIRNSLSHGRVTITEKDNFVFEDGRDESTLNFKIILSIENLWKFASKFCRCCVKEKWS